MNSQSDAKNPNATNTDQADEQAETGTEVHIDKASKPYRSSLAAFLDSLPVRNS